MPRSEPVRLSTFVAAAKHADWMQVVLNQGPPCFYLCNDAKFCLRAQRWAGHEDIHKFVSLTDLLMIVQATRGVAKVAKGKGKR